MCRGRCTALTKLVISSRANLIQGRIVHLLQPRLPLLGGRALETDESSKFSFVERLWLGEATAFIRSAQ